MADANVKRNFDDGSITISDDNGNSATLSGLIGDFSITGVQPNGREEAAYQTQGAYCSDRQGARVPVVVTANAMVARFDEDFHKIAMGTIAGYKSTTDDIGDGIRGDLQIDESFRTDSRIQLLEDARLVSWDYTAGQPGQVAMSFNCIGKVTLDGVVVIAGR